VAADAERVRACLSCGAIFGFGNDACPQCGADAGPRLEPDQRVKPCMSCGELVPFEDFYCVQCGKLAVALEEDDIPRRAVLRSQGTGIERAAFWVGEGLLVLGLAALVDAGIRLLV
jgi:RNA polymerase subunit RPABC4/transcription elongation factor Spt4